MTMPGPRVSWAWAMVPSGLAKTALRAKPKTRQSQSMAAGASW